MPYSSIIFDLDGTLIDSQESILSALRAALKESGLEEKISVTKKLIGPPLEETLSKITGLKDASTLKMASNKFKQYYDSVGYRDCVVYPGICRLLKSLNSQGYVLYIATNKRLNPTKKILDHLAWESLFAGIYSIDSDPENPFKNKAEMISSLLANELVDLKSAVYVGDRAEDYLAAKENGLPCILVNWGYDENLSKFVDDRFIINKPNELLNTIQRAL